MTNDKPTEPLRKLRNPVFCALDTADLGQATTWAAQVAESVGGLKLGLEFYAAHGPKGVQQVTKASGLPLFLDLKFHDIPNTVAGCVRSAAQMRPFMLTIHASGGPAMMEAAAKAAADAAYEVVAPRPLVLALTGFTSLDDNDLAEMGLNTSVTDQVKRLALMAKLAGVDGVVCSPHEAAMLRAEIGPDFILVTPGVRPAWSVTNDQKRIMTPKEALAAGSDYLVVGRPITGAENPAAAAARLAEEFAPAGA